MKNPTSEIILLIPHYNNISSLKESLMSIDESFTVDILIIDDGSLIKPDLYELEAVYSNGRIIIEYFSDNQGIEKALNFGLAKIKHSTYRYIGRLDCGDFCRKDKFKKQIEVLDHNPDIALLGSWANIVDQDLNLLYVLKHPTENEIIKKKMYLNSTFVHPTIVFRRTILNEIGLYPENYKYAEDYAFFFKIMRRYRVGNYPEALLDYVVSENSISTQKRKYQVKSRIRVILDNFYFGYYPIYGFFRNIMLLFMSRETTTYLKKITYKR